MRNLIVISSLFLLVGCVPAEVIVMKNPATGEVVQCRSSAGASIFPIIQTAIDNTASENCAKGYQAAGWIRMN